MKERLTCSDTYRAFSAEKEVRGPWRDSLFKAVRDLRKNLKMRDGTGYVMQLCQRGKARARFICKTGSKTTCRPTKVAQFGGLRGTVERGGFGTYALAFRDGSRQGVVCGGLKRLRELASKHERAVIVRGRTCAGAKEAARARLKTKARKTRARAKKRRR